MALSDAAGARMRPIPKSIVQRALEGVRYAITGVAPTTWFGPSQPLAPMAPAEVVGRRFDYPTGYNLQYGPRAYEPVGFADLRALADNCDILRLVIETRKDQIEAQDWDIRPKKTGAGARPRAGAFATEIAAAKSFLAFPDREHDFAQWTRQLAEEMFVIDAASLYKRRDRKGRVCAFEIIDGTTIAPRIDSWGRTPAPPDVAYQQILHGVPAADYARGGAAVMTTDELIYYPRNKRPGHVYGQSPVEQIILTANIVTRRSLHQLAYYTDGNLTDAVFTAPSGWTADQIATWQNFWNSLFAGNLRERRHGTWVPDGTKYVPLKDVVLKDAFDEYLARLVCFCFSISPQPFVAQVNRATAETAKEQAMEEGLGPVLAWFKRLIDRIVQLHLGYADLEFVWIDDREMDPSAADAIDVADVKAGIRTINEVRAGRGLDPLPGGDKLMIATANGYQPVGAPPAQTKPAPAKFGRARQPRELVKWNPDQPRWSAGAPESQGGRFAPKGEGGDGGDASETDDTVASASNASVRGSSSEGALDDGVYRPGHDGVTAQDAAASRMVLWEINPDSPYYATDAFRKWFDGSVTEFLVADAIAKAYVGDKELYNKTLRADVLQLPGGQTTFYDIYNVHGGPGMESLGRLAHNPASNVYYYSPYHYDPGPGVPNAWIAFHYPVFGKPSK
jgi:hypothetical protein